MTPKRERRTTRKGGERPARRVAEAPDFTIISGLSGAGRSEAAKCLEDLDYFVVDNLPPSLIGRMAELVATAGEPGRVAIVADARGGVFFPDLAKGLEDLRFRQVPYRILYLEASDEALVRRFEATRRRHPLAPEDRMAEGIRKERAMMEALRGEADVIVDTSDLTPHQLRDRIRETFARERPESGLQVSVVSFGYKFGIPRDADLVFDVRFLPNPHWVDELRPLAGTDGQVHDYVAAQPAYGEFMDRLRSLLEFLLPGYVAEGKAYLSIGVGCTGGRHRSVVVAEEIASVLGDRNLPVAVEHRDLDRE